MNKTLRVRVKDKHSKALDEMALAVNQVWNYCNDLSHKNIREKKNYMSKYDFNPYLKGSSKLLGVPQNTIHLVSHEYVKCRNKVKMPKLRWRRSFGNKKSLGWIPVSSYSLRFLDKKISFNEILFDIFNASYLEGHAFKQSSFNQDARGRWYFNATIKVECQSSDGKSAVGVDLGCKKSATSSCGTTLHGREYRELEGKLCVAQRAKNLNRVRAIHAKIQNRRRDSIHKFTTKLVKENAAIFVGNVNSKALTKTKMAKSVLDAGWGIIKQQLIYKCDYAGVVFEVIDERYSTQTCSSCGVIPESSPKGRAGLGIREWICSDCGAEHDRDKNAALNILALGHGRLAGGIINNNVGVNGEFYR